MARKNTELVRVSKAVFDKLDDHELRRIAERETRISFASRGDVVTYYFRLGVYHALNNAELTPKYSALPYIEERADVQE